jgi:hypothetical protein
MLDQTTTSNNKLPDASSSKWRDCVINAEHCRVKANRAQHEAARAALLREAEGWDKLADEAW